LKRVKVTRLVFGCDVRSWLLLIKLMPRKKKPKLQFKLLILQSRVVLRQKKAGARRIWLGKETRLRASQRGKR